jgi:hypothetical protein
MHKLLVGVDGLEVIMLPLLFLKGRGPFGTKEKMKELYRIQTPIFLDNGKQSSAFCFVEATT